MSDVTNYACAANANDILKDALEINWYKSEQDDSPVKPAAKKEAYWFTGGASSLKKHIFSLMCIPKNIKKANLLSTEVILATITTPVAGQGSGALWLCSVLASRVNFEIKSCDPHQGIEDYLQN
ncbi:hypothetical protein SERLA73DRAFT_149085 [Serpula lacrymans var. lacrymans S7.3]|uniref:Uncharacterized protein n=1 Tax=Serpula lacrymans var. lacrymans (strain S7.3) TaxID=936435 RepID=F8PEZ6_SERL3|nr:hypothetical protein SERLA73DRAFT_149085 [Serpula lacrymans var. lacrymans S7.3]